MGGIEHYYIYPVVYELFCMGNVIGANAQGSTYNEPALVILGRVWILLYFFYVLDGDQPLEVSFIVNNKEFFNTMLMQQGFRFFEGNADLGGYQVFAGHHISDL